MDLYEVYVIRCLLTGWLRIGVVKGTGMTRLRDEFRRARNTPMGVDMNRFGLRAFTVEPLISGLTRQEGDDWEQHFIQAFGTLYPRGYNLTTGGRRGTRWGPAARKWRSTQVLLKKNGGSSDQIRTRRRQEHIALVNAQLRKALRESSAKRERVSP